MNRRSDTFGVCPRLPTRYLKFQPTHGQTAFSVSACLRPPPLHLRSNIREPASLPAPHNKLYYALFLVQVLVEAHALREIISSPSPRRRLSATE